MHQVPDRYNTNRW